MSVDNETMEQQYIDTIKANFSIEGEKVKRKRLISFTIDKDSVHKLLSFIRTTLNFETLSMIACTDWIEDGQFELTYVMWSYSNKMQALVKTRIDRDNSVMNTLIPLWPQARTFEREIHEMYGVDFPGNDRLTEFMLEDWNFDPPLRRDFDTVSFVYEEYEMRKGREDAKDVKEYTKKKREEKKKLREQQNKKNDDKQ